VSLAARFAPLAVLVAILFVAGLVLNPDPVTVDFSRRFAPPSQELWLGADQLGRDLLARIIMGGVSAILIVALASCLSLALGLTLALAMLVAPRPVSRILERLSDFALAMPSLLVAVVLAAIVGLSGPAAALALGLGATAGVALFARGLLADALKASHVRAAEALGAGRLAVLSRHVVPHVVPTLLLSQSQDAAKMILAYAALTFLGLGADTSRPDWGAMIWEYRLFVFDVPRLIALPCMAIALTAWCFARVGDPVLSSRA
jgi:peptide/nickel transport system permease protein